MIHYDSLWFIMIHSLWFIMIHYDSLWFTMIHYDSVWFIILGYSLLFHYCSLLYIIIHSCPYVHHCEPHPGRKVVVVEFEAPGLALLALEEDVEGRRGVRHDPERDRLRRELRERGILLSLAVDLSWKVRSARDRTIRTFHIRVRSKFRQNSVKIQYILLENTTELFFRIVLHFRKCLRNFDKISSKL